MILELISEKKLQETLLLSELFWRRVESDLTTRANKYGNINANNEA